MQQGRWVPGQLVIRIGVDPAVFVQPAQPEEIAFLGRGIGQLKGPRMSRAKAFAQKTLRLLAVHTGIVKPLGGLPALHQGGDLSGGGGGVPVLHDPARDGAATGARPQSCGLPGHDLRGGKEKVLRQIGVRVLCARAIGQRLRFGGAKQAQLIELRAMQGGREMRRILPSRARFGLHLAHQPGGMFHISQRQHHLQQLPGRQRRQPRRAAGFGDLRGFFETPFVDHQMHPVDFKIEIGKPFRQHIQPVMARSKLTGFDRRAQELTPQTRGIGPAPHTGPQIAKPGPCLPCIQQPFPQQGRPLRAPTGRQRRPRHNQGLLWARQQGRGKGAEFRQARRLHATLQRLLQTGGGLG